MLFTLRIFFPTTIAGGENLRTTIIVNGKPMDVPDYATVSSDPGFK